MKRSPLQSLSTHSKSQTRRVLQGWLSGAVAVVLTTGLATLLHAAEPTASPLAVQRQRYQEAQQALAAGDLATFRQLHSALADYPLHPYLTQAELGARLDTLPEAEVVAFLQQQAGTVVASRLARQWVETLVAAARWDTAIQYHDPSNSSIELTCQLLHARLQAGDTTAFAAVAPLWNVPRSQPNDCDPVFVAWIEAGHLTASIGWERFHKTLQARQLDLARYISTQLPAHERALADTWLAVDQQPVLLQDLQRFSSTEPEITALILHGLQRLAQTDAPLAWQLWAAYDASHTFTDEARLTTQRVVIQRLLTQDQRATAEALLRADPALPSTALVEWLLRAALKQQDWDSFDSWLPLLPTDARATERWRYWQARALARHDTPAAQAEANALLAGLATTRNFYGFLAADQLGRSYELVDRPVTVDAATLQQASTTPALVRAFELFAVGDEPSAMREWQQAVASMNEQQVLAAGKLADAQGWHRNGIQALIQVSYWDDLQIRFPLAYQDLMNGAAETHATLDTTFVYAIARQESAFMHDVRSSVGAMGLMQLMPATAREVAAAAGLQLTSNEDILKPEVNIALGSQYLARMLQDFGGNRILAAAAYNAGPARVRQWLNQSSNNRLPFDIWIETIPFTETRGYVQNVLAFAVIYGYRMGQTLPLLTEAEAQSLL